MSIRSCEPCPMCLAATYWARCRTIYYGCTAADAAKAGFDDAFLYEEMKKPMGERTLPMVNLMSRGCGHGVCGLDREPEEGGVLMLDEKTVRVGLLGFGTVGARLPRCWRRMPDAGVRITHVFNRGVERKTDA